MYTCAALTVLGTFLLFFYVREKLLCYSVKALFLKTAVSVFFVAVGLSALYCNPSRFGFFVLGGLLCGILGDIWLDLKYVYREDDIPYTYAGFLAFAVGHVLFLSGMLSDYGQSASTVSLSLAIGGSLLLGFVTVFGGPLLKLDYGRFKGISLLYGPLLFATTLFSLVLSMSKGYRQSALNLMLLGGVLFALSDLVLCGTYFGKGRERPVDIILNYIFYYGAQFVIAWSILLA